MDERDVLVGVLLDDACLTLDQLCSLCAVDPDWVAGHVRLGHLPADTADPGRWRFGSREIRRVRQIRQVEVAFDAVPELAALVADLIEELDGLRAQRRRRG
jgi:chaperone modulatory protein CbpM